MSARLDKRVAEATGLGRSRAAALVRAGRVRVDGAPVRDPGIRLAPGAVLCVDGAPLGSDEGPRYLVLHKPAGYVCAHGGDAHHPGALELIDFPGRDRLHFAGRLDADTTGLLLVTDDGAWSHRITSPRRHCPKTYLATLDDPLVGDAAERFARGLLLRGDEKPTLPARLDVLDAGRRQVRVVLEEGRYHQVRRMFAALGNRVLTLHRERVGTLTLDGLAEGQWRPLTGAEREALG
jgi:16S rRNA pseudouridine516 synthase